MDPLSVAHRRMSHYQAGCLSAAPARRTSSYSQSLPAWCWRVTHQQSHRRQSECRAIMQGPSSSDPSESEPGKQQSSSEWDGWDDWEQDWGEWTEEPDQARKATQAKGSKGGKSNSAGRRVLRDEYLRPMIDAQGIRQRLGFKREQFEQQVQQEFEDNQQESREAVKFAAFLITVPLLVGFCVSRLVADPFFEFVQHQNPQAFAVTDNQKVEGAHEVHKEELRLRMDAAIGRAPPLTDKELQPLLREEALLLVEKFQQRNREAMLNVISDSTSAVTLFLVLVKESEGRTTLFNALSRVFAGLSDTAKAFLIIASTDILLGYHSEEGWTAGIRLLTSHYGFEAEEHPIYVFVAIVPVVMDAIFKYWIFVGLNRQDPAAAVTLKSMDRH